MTRSGKIPPNLRHVLALNFLLADRIRQEDFCKPDFSKPVCQQTQALNVMLIVQTRLSPVDKLWTLWAICLVQHYNETNKKTSKFNIINEFGDQTFQYWKTGCELAEDYNLIDTMTMRLTPKGLTACRQWKAISQSIYSV